MKSLMLALIKFRGGERYFDAIQCPSGRPFNLISMMANPRVIRGNSQSQGMGSSQVRCQWQLASPVLRTEGSSFARASLISPCSSNSEAPSGVAASFRVIKCYPRSVVVDLEVEVKFPAFLSVWADSVSGARILPANRPPFYSHVPKKHKNRRCPNIGFRFSNVTIEGYERKYVSGCHGHIPKCCVGS